MSSSKRSVPEPTFPIILIGTYTGCKGIRVALSIISVSPAITSSPSAIIRRTPKNGSECHQIAAVNQKGKLSVLSGGSSRSNPLNRGLRLDAAWRADLPGVPGRQHHPRKGQIHQQSSCDSETTNIQPSCEIPVHSLKHDSHCGKNYLENKLEAQLEIQRRESDTSEPSEHCPSDTAIRSYDPAETRDSLRHVDRKQ